MSFCGVWWFKIYWLAFYVFKRMSMFCFSLLNFLDCIFCQTQPASRSWGSHVSNMWRYCIKKVFQIFFWTSNITMHCFCIYFYCCVVKLHYGVWSTVQYLCITRSVLQYTMRWEARETKIPNAKWRTLYANYEEVCPI